MNPEPSQAEGSFIIKIMQYHNNILCISHGELTDGIISASNYKLMVHRNKMRVIQRACFGTPALVAFDSLPDHIKTACIEKYGNPRETAAHDQFRSYVETDASAWRFYSSYQLTDGRYLPSDVQRAYCNNASVLNAIHHIVNDRKALIKALGGNSRHVWPRISEIVNALKTELGHDLPENYRRLQAKLNDYKKESYVALISGKFLNKNASKVADIDQEALIRQLFRKANNLDNQQVADLYNIIAEVKGWDKITNSTVANYRVKWDIRTIGARRGETNFDNTKAMLVKRSAPTLPLIYWTSDGWEAELLYQTTENDTKGNSRTTYHNRLTMVVVLDPCEKYPIGYAIGTHETPALIREAFRNAINHTAELFGARHQVHQLQTDNYGKKTLKPMYEAISDKFTPARVKNAKSKVIEPYFMYLNKKYCQLMPNWSGFGVTAKKEHQPSDQYLNKIRHSFPDEAGVRMQLEHIIAMERELKIAKYRKAYEELPSEDRLFMTDHEYLLHLGETTGFTNRLTAPGLVVTLDGVRREYDSFDIGFRQHSDEQWKVYYDPSETSRILAVNASTGTIRFELQEKYVQPMAIYDQKPEDHVAIKQIRDFNKSMKEEIMDDMQQDSKVVQELFSNNLLDGTLTKLVLCDSNGQHKDNKSAARLTGGRKLLAKQIKKEADESEKSWTEQQNEYLSKKVDINKYLNQ